MKLFELPKFAYLAIKETREEKEKGTSYKIKENSEERERWTGSSIRG